MEKHIDKDAAAQQLAQRDGIQHGLICIYSILEPCRTFSFVFYKPGPDRRKSSM